jgi:hypothetical protein
MNYDRNPLSLFARPKNVAEHGDDHPFAPFRLPDDPAPKRPDRQPSDKEATASAIIRAGQKRRNEISEDLRPPVGSLGRAILDAAAKARGGI